MHNNSFYIRELTQNDNLSVYNVWRDCFTDDTSYIETFFKECFPFCINLGLFIEGEDNALSILSLLPCYIKEKGVKFSGAYMYGVGTLSSHRGKGYSYALTKEAFRICSTRGYAFMTVKPAEDSLYQLYSKQGFETEIKSTTITYKINELISQNNYLNKATPIIEADYLFKLKSTSQHKSHILLSKEITRYAHLELSQRKGVCVEIEREVENNESERYFPYYTDEQLFFCAYPYEEKDDTIKVIDHSIRNLNDIVSCTNAIRNIFPKFKFIAIELTDTTANNLIDLLKIERTIKIETSKNCMISSIKDNIATSKLPDIEKKFLSLSIE